MHRRCRSSFIESSILPKMRKSQINYYRNIRTARPWCAGDGRKRRERRGKKERRSCNYKIKFKDCIFTIFDRTAAAVHCAMPCEMRSVAYSFLFDFVYIQPPSRFVHSNEIPDAYTVYPESRRFNVFRRNSIRNGMYSMVEWKSYHSLNQCNAGLHEKFYGNRMIAD